MKNNPIIVLCTTPDYDCAKKIAQILVEKKLAACCNIIPGLTSVYSWKNKIQEDIESLLLIKSAKQKFELLKEEILLVHPYDLPEIISLDVSEGHKKYLEWVFSSVKGKNEN